jgi:hypothetical protein
MYHSRRRVVAAIMVSLCLASLRLLLCPALLIFFTHGVFGGVDILLSMSQLV